MAEISERIRKYAPLDEIECAFRYIHENHLPLSAVDANSEEFRKFFCDSAILYSYHEYAGFEAVIDTIRDGESLADDRFFLPNQTISITKHPRYMPAFLHNHQFIEIQFLLRGELSQRIGNADVTLQIGDMCFIAPSAKHILYLAQEETIMINLLVRVDTLRTAFANSLSDSNIISKFLLRVLSGQTHQPLLVCRTGEDSRITNLILDMLEENGKTDPLTDSLIKTMMELLFIYLMRDHDEHFSVGRTLQKHDDNILLILHYIQNHYAEITLSDLARHFNYAETYLSYTIRAYTGQTFSEIVIDLRLQKAASHLKSSSESVADIMTAVGYSDRTYFYKLFKKKYGLTPAQYRETITQD